MVQVDLVGFVEEEIREVEGAAARGRVCGDESYGYALEDVWCIWLDGWDELQERVRILAKGGQVDLDGLIAAKSWLVNNVTWLNPGDVDQWVEDVKKILVASH
jgi:hypothetical protein